MVNYSFFSEEKIFLFILIVSLNEYTYSSSDVCSCTLNNLDDDFQRHLLTNLKNHSLCGKKFEVDAEDQYEYHFIICGQVGDAPNVTLEKKDTSQEGNNTPLGYKNYTSVIGMTGPGAWMLLTFNPPKNETKDNNSSSNSSTPTPSPTSCQPHSSVMLICDKNYPDGQFRFGYYDKNICLYVFELRIAAICEEKSGMSGFSIFLIILVVAFALYFICGVLYNRTQLGSKGIDQIPHRRFWFGLGNKFADCFSALCRCDQYCSETEHLDNHSQYSGGYSPIGETVGGKPPGMASSSPGYERDSQLISP